MYICTESSKQTLSRNTYAGNLSLRSQTNVTGLQNSNVRSPKLSQEILNQFNDRSKVKQSVQIIDENSTVRSGITVQVIDQMHSAGISVQKFKRKCQFIDRSNKFAGIFDQVDRNNSSKGKFQFESRLQTFGSPLEIQTMVAKSQFIDRTKFKHLQENKSTIINQT